MYQALKNLSQEYNRSGENTIFYSPISLCFLNVVTCKTLILNQEFDAARKQNQYLNNFTEAHYLYCILLLTGIKEVSWKSAKGMMSEANFLKSLTEMDVDAITAKQTATVKGNSPTYTVHQFIFFGFQLIFNTKMQKFE